LPSVKRVYCFDTKGTLEDGSFRVTAWDSIEPTAFLSRRNGDLLIGKNGYIGTYTGYLDDTSTYRIAYYTNNSDLNDDAQISILKRIKVTVLGASNQYFTVKWGYNFSSSYLSENVYIPAQGVAEYGIAEYGANATPVAEYSTGIVLSELIVNGTGAGKIVQTGYEIDINGSAISIQKIELQSKNGKLV